MQIAIWVEPVDGIGFRATGSAPIPLHADGATRDEAVRNLGAKIRERLAGGAVLLPLDFPGETHPLPSPLDDLKDEPLLDRWKRAMAEYRRRADEEDEARG